VVVFEAKQLEAETEEEFDETVATDALNEEQDLFFLDGLLRFCLTRESMALN